MFIGSSGAGKLTAEMIQMLLVDAVDCTVWHQGVFGLSSGTLESLVAAVDDYDFATLVLTPDDALEQRGIVGRSPRDNVLFELGLFMGALGRERTFIVQSRTQPLLLPTDLAGITSATFEGENLPALGPACTTIKLAIMAIEATRQKETRKAFWNKLKGIIGGATDPESQEGALKQLFELLRTNISRTHAPVIRLWGGYNGTVASSMGRLQKIGQAIGRCCATSGMSLSGSRLQQSNLEYWAAFGAAFSAKGAPAVPDSDPVRLYLHYNGAELPYTEGEGEVLYKDLRATSSVIDVKYPDYSSAAAKELNTEVNHQSLPSYDACIGSLFQCDAILLIGGNEAARHCIQLTAFISRHNLRAARPIVFVPLPWVGGTAERAFRAFNGVVEDLDHRTLGEDNAVER